MSQYNVSDLQYIINNLLTQKLSVSTPYGDIYLDGEAQLIVQRELTKLFQARIKALSKNER